MTPEVKAKPFPRNIQTRYGLAVLVCGLTTLAALPLHSVLDLANIVMIFLFAVFLVATFLGRGPAVMAAFLSVALFDFFFVPPQLSFEVADMQYLVTFSVMLTVGLVTAHLASRLAEKKEQALQSEHETRGLYELAREMAGAISLVQVAEATQGYFRNRDLNARILLADDLGDVMLQGSGEHTLRSIEHSFAGSAYRRNEIIEADSLAGMGVAAAFFPLRAPTRVRGVLAVAPVGDDATRLRELRQPIEVVASLVALAVERLHYADAARQAELQVAEERLRISVLSALSHDLRTPLTTLVGLADSLAQQDKGLSPDAAEIAGIIREQARAMHRLLSDLLDMARLQGSSTTLRREWQPFEEVVGSSLRLVEGLAGSRPVTVNLQPDMPLMYFDAVLMERVLFNLLDNAFKYSPSGTPVAVATTLDDATLNVSVCNEGQGFPGDRLDAMFDIFVRGHDETSIPGVGLGLAICKAIVTAHEGTIRAENSPGGACVHFTLPCGTPPTVEEETT